jgi:hypothetical protein
VKSILPSGVIVPKPLIWWGIFKLICLTLLFGEALENSQFASFRISIQTLAFDAKVKLNSKTDLGMITFCCFIVVGLEMTKKDSDECYCCHASFAFNERFTLQLRLCVGSRALVIGIVFFHALNHDLSKRAISKINEEGHGSGE